MSSVFDCVVVSLIVIIQIGLPCLAALFILKPLFFRITKWKKTVYRQVGVSVISLIVVFAGLAFWITHPPIFCPKEFQESFTPEKRTEAQELGKYTGGFFFPLAMSVLNIQGNVVTIEIQYGFLGGTVVMEYGGMDGIDIIEPIH